MSQICQPPPKTSIHVVLKPSASTGVGGHAQEPHVKASEWRVAGTRDARLARPGDDVHLPPPRSGAEKTASSIAMLNVECGTGGKGGHPIDSTCLLMNLAEHPHKSSLALYYLPLTDSSFPVPSYVDSRGADSARVCHAPRPFRRPSLELDMYNPCRVACAVILP